MDNFRLLTAWICGYGFGLVMAATTLYKSADMPLVFFIVIFLGFIIGLSAWFFDYAYKKNGLIDKLTDKAMIKKYGTTGRKENEN